MYDVPQRERLIGAGPRSIQVVYVTSGQSVTLENMLKIGVLTKSQYTFLSRRPIQMFFKETVYDVSRNSCEHVYEIWADLTLRDETAYALLSA